MPVLPGNLLSTGGSSVEGGGLLLRAVGRRLRVVVVISGLDERIGRLVRTVRIVSI